MEPGKQPDWLDADALKSAAETIEAAVTDTGERLVDLSATSTVLLVFLRHSGCTFCREALSDIAASRSRAESAGIRIVLVHMGDEEGINQLLKELSLLNAISEEMRNRFFAIWLPILIGVFGEALPLAAFASSAASIRLTFDYDGQIQTKVAYDEGEESAIRYDAVSVLVESGGKSGTTSCQTRRISCRK